MDKIKKDTIDSLVKALNEQRLILFCGAGISMLPPSASPSWWDIYAAAAKALSARFVDKYPHATAKIDLNSLLAPLDTQELANIISQRFAGPTFSNLLSVVDIADANENHRAIATLAKKNCLRGVLTTNFDTLIERAAISCDYAFDIASPGIQAKKDPAKCTLIKIHGTTVDTLNLIETSREKAREINPTLKDAWDPLVEGADLLVLGYSGADLNFGAANAFFNDFLASGKRIFWLYRSGRLPKLPKEVEARTTFIEGGLPTPLKQMVEAIGEQDFKTHVTGRDSHAQMALAMESWSKELHIGPWAACSFFLALLESRPNQNQSTREALFDIASQEANRFETNKPISIEDIGAAAFYSMAGLNALQRFDLDSAELFLRISCNIYGTLDKVNEQQEKESGQGQGISYAERHMNLSSVWNNYGYTKLLKQEQKQSLISYQKSLHHAYLAGNQHSALVALHSILHYSIQFKDLRKSMSQAEAATALADKIGSVQSSIELRLLLACFAFDRNEIWLGLDWLKEAHRRATALNDYNSKMVADLMLAEHALRQGDIENGLNSLATTLQNTKITAFFVLPVERLRRYLEVLGSPQPTPFMIDFSHDDIAPLINNINAENQQAKLSGIIPWKGAHCSLSPSAVADKNEFTALAKMGHHEYSVERKEAIQLGLDYAEFLCNQGRFMEARWGAKNALLNPVIDVSAQAKSHTLLAHISASIGDLVIAKTHLMAAKHINEEANIHALPTLARTGLWLSIQSSNFSSALNWAKCAINLLNEGALPPETLEKELTMLTSWGAPLQPICKLFNQALYGKEIQIKIPPGVPPFRLYNGAVRSFDEANDNVTNAIMQVQSALQQEQYREALEFIDKLADEGAFCEEQLGQVITMQIHAFSHLVDQESLESIVADFRQRYLTVRAFNVLTRLETAYARALVMRYENKIKAYDVISKYGFLTDLCTDPIAKGSLLAWVTTKEALLGKPIQLKGDIHVTSAYFFNLPEVTMFKTNFSPVSREKSSTSEQSSTGIIQVLMSRLDSTDDSDVADKAITHALKQLRKMRKLKRENLAGIIGDRANWALRQQRFEEAKHLFRRVANSFRILGSTVNELNAMAGEARAHSRSGDHAVAVNIFNKAIKKSNAYNIRFNLLLGLGSAHLREATEGRKEANHALIDLAIEAFVQAEESKIGDQERPLSKIALAMALGEKKEQDRALAKFDEAIADFAHMGDPRAKMLQENRKIFVDGDWRGLTLF